VVSSISFYALPVLLITATVLMIINASFAIFMNRGGMASKETSSFFFP
jgi:hypothetical protein